MDKVLDVEVGKGPVREELVGAPFQSLIGAIEILASWRPDGHALIP
jgi:hypothetical protein